MPTTAPPAVRRAPTVSTIAMLVTVLLTVALVAALGAALEMLLLRRVYRAPELLQLLATFGVLLMLQDATLLIWGPAELTLPRAPWMRGFVTIGQSRFPQYDLMLIAAGPVVLGGLWALFRTRWGTLVRAATLDRDMVAALGVDQRWLFTGVFTLGAGLPDFAAQGSMREAGLATLLKLLVQPLLVWVLAHLAGLGAVPTAVAVLTAGTPTGANAFFLARRTGTLAAASAGTVVVSTALSVLTLSAILALLR